MGFCFILSFLSTSFHTEALGPFFAWSNCLSYYRNSIHASNNNKHTIVSTSHLSPNGPSHCNHQYCYNSRRIELSSSLFEAATIAGHHLGPSQLPHAIPTIATALATLGRFPLGAFPGRFGRFDVLGCLSDGIFLTAFGRLG